MSTAELLDPRGCICDTTDRASCGGWRQFATVTKSCSCACHAALETAPATAPLVSAADAQRLLDGASTPGPWEMGAERVYAIVGCPRHLPGGGEPVEGARCACRTVVTNARDGDLDLLAAAPDLARTVVALHALIKGRP